MTDESPLDKPAPVLVGTPKLADANRPPITAGPAPKAASPIGGGASIVALVREATGYCDIEHITPEELTAQNTLLHQAVAHLNLICPPGVGHPLRPLVHKIDSCRCVLAAGKLTYEERQAQSEVLEECLTTLDEMGEK
jgi:hypothetical protein